MNIKKKKRIEITKSLKLQVKIKFEYMIVAYIYNAKITLILLTIIPYLTDTFVQSVLHFIINVKSLGSKPLFLVLLEACLRYMITSLRILRVQNPGEHIGTPEQEVKAEAHII